MLLVDTQQALAPFTALTCQLLNLQQIPAEGTCCSRLLRTQEKVRGPRNLVIGQDYRD